MLQAVRQLNEAVSSLPADCDCDALLVMPLYAAMPPDMQVQQSCSHQAHGNLFCHSKHLHAHGHGLHPLELLCGTLCLAAQKLLAAIYLP